MAQNTVISYPIPIYQNLPIEPQFYNPGFFVISGITLGQTTTVTTTANITFQVGQLCRILIPNGYGCRQLNEVTGYVISIPAPNQVILNICSAGGDAFKSSTNTTQPTIVPIGDINSGQINSNGLSNQGLSVPGSFINVS